MCCCNWPRGSRWRRRGGRTRRWGGAGGRGDRGVRAREGTLSRVRRTAECVRRARGDLQGEGRYEARGAGAVDDGVAVETDYASSVELADLLSATGDKAGAAAALER